MRQSFIGETLQDLHPPSPTPTMVQSMVRVPGCRLDCRRPKGTACQKEERSPRGGGRRQESITSRGRENGGAMHPPPPYHATNRRTGGGDPSSNPSLCSVFQFFSTSHAFSFNQLESVMKSDKLKACSR
jgi:hypothetical protein